MAAALICLAFQVALLTHIIESQSLQLGPHPSGGLIVMLFLGGAATFTVLVWTVVNACLDAGRRRAVWIVVCVLFGALGCLAYWTTVVVGTRGETASV